MMGIDRPKAGKQRRIGEKWQAANLISCLLLLILTLVWEGALAQNYSTGYGQPAYSSGTYQMIRQYPLPSYQAPGVEPLCLTCNHCQVNLVPSILPVRILQFEAERMENEEVELRWWLSDSDQQDHIRLYVGADVSANSFSFLASVEGNPQGRYHHDSAPPERLYYQMEILYPDGQSEWSPIREVAAVSHQPKLTLFPNPGETEIQLEFTGWPEGAVSLRMIDMQGREVQKWILTNSESQVVVADQGLPAGIYVIEARQNYILLRHTWIKR